MEFFNQAKAIKLRSHLGKYLVADEDQETVRQSRNGSSRKARWIIEFVEDNPQFLRLKSCHGRYLTASDAPFLLGMTGKRVLQTVPESSPGRSTEWEPIRDGFQVKLRTHGGKYLRANGGTPPWRNSITHDNPHRTKTQDWVLWDVEKAEITEYEMSVDYLSPLSSFSSSFSDEAFGSGPMSPMSVASSNYCTWTPGKRIGMELFHNAKAVRLKGHHDKYLYAEEDEESVSQSRSGSSKNARWTLEFVDSQYIRLKSCYGKYLTASNQPFLLGMTGRKVFQTLPPRLDSSVEWEPVRDGSQVRLKTRYGHFLRANGGLPPWRNSVTHDIPHRTATQDWVLWDVDIVEIQVQSPSPKSPLPSAPSPSAPDASVFYPDSNSVFSEPSSPSSASVQSAKFSRQESNESTVSSPPKVDGRTIYYHIADENGEVEGEDLDGYSMNFKGNSVEELTRRLEEETGIEDIIVCFRSPLNRKLYPLRLQLPPNNTIMHVVVVPSSATVAGDFGRAGIA